MKRMIFILTFSLAAGMAGVGCGPSNKQLRAIDFYLGRAQETENCAMKDVYIRSARMEVLRRSNGRFGRKF